MPAMPAPRKTEFHRPPRSVWLSAPALEALHAANTDAHRIFSSQDAWMERFGDDALLSYKTDAAKESTLRDLPGWLETHALRFRRIFGKFIPRLNEDRIAPTLISGDSSLPLTTTVLENGLRFGL